MMATSPTKWFRSTRSYSLLLVVIVASLRLSAQTPSATGSHNGLQAGSPSPLRFEVASIRTHRAVGNDEPSNRQVLPGGRFVATATPLRTFIRIAFGTDDVRINGAPSWIDNKTFDIDATTENHAEVTTTEQFQQLILTLLEDRFQFKFHREEKEAPVYWLELEKPGRLGPALKPSTPDSQPNMSSNSNGSRVAMKVSKMSMTDIAAGLRRQAGRPVENHTDLKGNFDFHIEWSPEETPNSADPSLFTVLKEQLGLKLQPAKGTVEVIVVDQINEPSAN